MKNAKLSAMRRRLWADADGPYRNMNRTKKSGPKPIGQRMVRGYVYIYRPDHPHTIGAGYVKRSRLVVEASLNRFLDPNEHVHHINGIKTDDRIENLVVVSRAEHNHIHKAGRRPPAQSWADHGLSACTVCGRNDRRYVARNMCHACYEGARRIRLKQG